MEKILPSSNLYSHPGRLLEDHLVGVARLSELFLQNKPSIGGEVLHEVCRITALSHDVGKATRFFQQYLHANEKEKSRLRKQDETNHGLFSALCAYYVTKTAATAWQSEIANYPLFAFIAVKRHHGDLQDVRDELCFGDEEVTLLKKQLDSIDENSLSILALRLSNAGFPVILTKDTIATWIEDFQKESCNLRKKIRKMEFRLSDYLLLNLIYSVLIDADKSDVVVREMTPFVRNVSFLNDSLVDSYKSKANFVPSAINKLRDLAYEEVISQEISLQRKIYSLNLPTGLGKTLISFSFALKLRKQITDIDGRARPRIIYCLPFLSIIDQNASIFEDILELNGIEPNSDVLLKHHHLSEVYYKTENDEFEPDAAKILVEGWNSEIIVTTFVQLFYTLVSNRNKNVRKFHRIANSILILDEVQSIPIKYWLLVKELLAELAERMGVYILFVTATQPLIFEKDRIFSLVHSDWYFKSMNRVIVQPMLDKDISVEELRDAFEPDEGKRSLFIFNTIKSAKEFFGLIQQKENDIAFLSTHVVPKERLDRIQEIRAGKYKVVVSTQLVEAGVDIDFDVVIRDIAPLDSINQSAGRCNRGGNRKGTVYIVSLTDTKKRYASYIYDPVLIDITRHILATHTEIEEHQFLSLVEEYYKETEKAKTKQHSRDLLDAIEKLRYDSDDERHSIAGFKLIEEDRPRKDVFIEVDEPAVEIWKRYLLIRKVKDLFERKREFNSIKPRFYQYVISLPTNTSNLPEEIEGFGYVSKSHLDDYYDCKTGFRTIDPRDLLIF